MKNIIFSHEFHYFRKGIKRPLKIVPCTEKESLESAKSILREYGYDKVKKIEREFYEIGDDLSFLFWNNINNNKK